MHDVMDQVQVVRVLLHVQQDNIVKHEVVVVVHVQIKRELLIIQVIELIIIVVGLVILIIIEVIVEHLVLHIVRIAIIH